MVDTISKNSWKPSPTVYVGSCNSS